MSTNGKRKGLEVAAPSPNTESHTYAPIMSRNSVQAENKSAVIGGVA